MKSYQVQAFVAESIKVRHSKILLITFISFSIAPLLAGLLMLVMRNPKALDNASALKIKAEMMAVSVNWNSFLGILSQAVAVGGFLIFGFVISWLFGSEYSNGTAKDLLALPTSRTKILNAKFFMYVIWCLSLSISNLLIGFIIGTIIDLPGLQYSVVSKNIEVYSITTCLIILLGIPVAFFALWGRGYLAPLGIVALVMVLAQILAAIGYGQYFPWSIPGFLSGLGGENKSGLTALSYFILGITPIIGYFAAMVWWKNADDID
jgi:ABC-type transport system involved in multi-copper enzyme maturation permease subunit